MRSRWERQVEAQLGGERKIPVQHEASRAELVLLDTFPSTPRQQPAANVLFFWKAAHGDA